MKHYPMRKILWNQELISENRQVYRAEYLAVDLFRPSKNSLEIASVSRRSRCFLGADPKRRAIR